MWTNLGPNKTVLHAIQLYIRYNRFIKYEVAVYTDKPETLDALEENIWHVTADIPPQSL